jgi:trehalose 6-phosphate phosphatase
VYESDSDSDNATRALARRVVHLFDAKRSALVTDVDGTISPVVARPEEAIVLPKARDALRGLRDVLDVVAVVTGRSVEDARRMVGVDGLAYVGNHGLEVWGDGRPETVPEARPWVRRLAAVLGEVARQLETGAALEPSDKGDFEPDPYVTPPGSVLIENKGASASLHYRLAPDPPAARRQLLGILARTAVTSGLRVEEGRMVINLLPPLTVSKGSAVTWLAREHHLESIAYLGDDVTDAHAFRALGMLRQSYGLATMSIGVVGPETAPSVRQLADAILPSVQAVANLLCELLECLRSSATMNSGAPSVGST